MDWQPAGLVCRAATPARPRGGLAMNGRAGIAIGQVAAWRCDLCAATTILKERDGIKGRAVVL
eukprot:946631-Heterocapsa_arctica.AAC.1